MCTLMALIFVAAKVICHYRKRLNIFILKCVRIKLFAGGKNGVEKYYPFFFKLYVEICLQLACSLTSSRLGCFFC